MVAFVPLLATTGCRGATSGTAVELWAIGREGEVVQQMLADFERRTPGVRVRVQQIPWSAAHEKLLTAYVGGTMPDVFQAGNTWIPELVALDAVEPLDSWIAKSPAIDPEDYFRGAWEPNRIDGHTFGLPWYVDTRLLFYRSDLLERAGYPEAPRTWVSWIDAMTRVKESGGDATYAILLPVNEWEAPVLLGLQVGARLLRDGDRYSNFRGLRFRRAFDFYLRLFRRGLAPRAGQAQIANLYQEFARGYFAFYISGPWNLGEFGRRLPPELQPRWTTAPMPSPDGHYPGASLAGGASLALFRGSSQKQAAWKLIEYLSEPDRQVRFYRLTGDLPSRQSAWRQPDLRDDRRVQAFWSQLQHVRSTPKVPEWERIAQQVAHYSEAAIRGSMTAEQALAALDRDVDQILEKRRWLLRRTPGRSPEEPERAQP